MKKLIAIFFLFVLNQNSTKADGKSFFPVPPCATYVSPSNGSTGLGYCGGVLLDWNAAGVGGGSASSYDVYFGTTNPPAFYANTTATSYTIPTLLPNTTYYWYIIPKNGSGSASGCSIYSFTTTTSNPSYSLIGSATSTAPYDCTTLTTATNDQKGCAWDVNSTLNFTSSFSYDFTVNLGNSDGGADGIAFVMQNDPAGICACGNTGGAMGSGGISNSLIFELDTYMNYEDRDDFCGGDWVGCIGTTEWDHLDVWTGSTFNPDNDGNCDAVGAGERPYVSCAVPLKNGGSLYNIENGANHIMRVSWNSSTNTMTVTILDATGTTTYGTISYSFNPSTVFGTNTPYFGMTASTGGLNNNQSFCLPAAFLPIELLSFDANCESRNMKLTWSTASETNNDYFTIERSLNGIIYTPLAKITGSGTTTLQHNYTWYDENPEQGINYYRLRQTDYNSESAYYKVAAGSCKTELPFSEIEAITQNEILVSINLKENEKISVRTFDMIGKELKTINKYFEKGNNLLAIPTEEISNGVYLILVSSSTKNITHKVITK